MVQGLRPIAIGPRGALQESLYLISIRNTLQSNGALQVVSKRLGNDDAGEFFERASDKSARAGASFTIRFATAFTFSAFSAFTLSTNIAVMFPPPYTYVLTIQHCWEIVKGKVYRRKVFSCG